MNETVRRLEPESPAEDADQSGALGRARTAMRMASNAARLFLFRQFDQPPIILGGCGRSGTTLFLAVLSAHEAVVAIAEETYCFCPTAYSDLPDPSAELQTRRFYGELLRHRIPRSARRWCEKTPKNVVFFGQILREFGEDVRLIHTVRDGRDVMTSVHPDDPHTYYISPERWVNDVTAGLEYEDHHQVLTVKYEDLVLDFEDTVGTMGDFLDLDMSSVIGRWLKTTAVREAHAWGGSVKPIHRDSVGRWKKPEYRQRVDEIMSHEGVVRLLDRLDYPLG